MLVIVTCIGTVSMDVVNMFSFASSMLFCTMSPNTPKLNRTAQVHNSLSHIDLEIDFFFERGRRDWKDIHSTCMRLSRTSRQPDIGSRVQRFP